MYQVEAESYLIQAFGPRDRDPIPIGQWHQAQNRLRGIRTMPLPVIIHFPTELAIEFRIFTRHVIDVLRGAGFDVSREEFPQVLPENVP